MAGKIASRGVGRANATLHLWSAPRGNAKRMECLSAGGYTAQASGLEMTSAARGAFTGARRRTGASTEHIKLSAVCMWCYYRLHLDHVEPQ